MSGTTSALLMVAALDKLEERERSLGGDFDLSTEHRLAEIELRLAQCRREAAQTGDLPLGVLESAGAHLIQLHLDAFRAQAVKAQSGVCPMCGDDDPCDRAGLLGCDHPEFIR